MWVLLILIMLDSFLIAGFQLLGFTSSMENSVDPDQLSFQKQADLDVH